MFTTFTAIAEFTNKHPIITICIKSCIAYPLVFFILSHFHKYSTIIAIVAGMMSIGIAELIVMVIHMITDMCKSE